MGDWIGSQTWAVLTIITRRQSDTICHILLPHGRIFGLSWCHAPPDLSRQPQPRQDLIDQDSPPSVGSSNILLISSTGVQAVLLCSLLVNKYTQRLYFGHFGFASQHKLKEYFGVSIHSFRWQHHSFASQHVLYLFAVTVYSPRWQQWPMVLELVLCLTLCLENFSPRRWFNQQNLNITNKNCQNITKQKLPTKFSLMNCPQLRAFGSCTAQVTLSLCWCNSSC